MICTWWGHRRVVSQRKIGSTHSRLDSKVRCLCVSFSLSLLPNCFFYLECQIELCMSKVMGHRTFKTLRTFPNN